MRRPNTLASCRPNRTMWSFALPVARSPSSRVRRFWTRVLRSGLKLNFSCTVGGCAACKLKVISGAVAVDEPNCLSDQERSAGYILSCSAYAQESVVLDA